MLHGPRMGRPAPLHRLRAPGHRGRCATPADPGAAAVDVADRAGQPCSCPPRGKGHVVMELSAVPPIRCPLCGGRLDVIGARTGSTAWDSEDHPAGFACDVCSTTWDEDGQPVSVDPEAVTAALNREPPW